MTATHYKKIQNIRLPLEDTVGEEVVELTTSCESGTYVNETQLGSDALKIVFGKTS